MQKSTLMKEVNPILKKILETRGVREEQFEEFFSNAPKLTHDPFLLSDMRAGVDLLLSEIDKGSRIVIYGDYDADGVTSTALMLRALGELTDKLDYYIPSRMDEGYGLNKDAIDRIHEKGCELIITVDCGVSSKEETEYAHSLGIKTIVTDHHNVSDEVASGIVIDPRRADDEYPFKFLAGVGVAFKFIQAVSSERTISKRVLNSVLELVAIGTVADVMPLVDENRTFVKYGLRNMRLGCYNKCLAKLLEKMDISPDAIRARTISFGIAPRINSAGRLEDASLGVKALLTEDPAEIEEYCDKLDELNSKRRALTDAAEEECVEKAEEEIKKNNFLILEAVGQHEGVLGIAAGHIKDRYNRPTIIISENGDEYKGTGRSIANVDLFSMLDKYRDIFVRFGGHKAACGFTIKRSKIERLKEALNSDLDELSKGDDSFFDRELSYDAVISPADVSIELVEQLEKLEPCGVGNEEPRFKFDDVNLGSWRYLKNGTDMARLKLGELEAVIFGGAERYHGFFERGEKVSVIGKLSANEWQGRRTPRLKIDMIKKEV